MGVGAIFCGVGRLFVLAFFGLAPYYFIDQNKSLGDAFSASLEATSRNSGVAAGDRVGRARRLRSASSLCYIGALVTMPMAYVGVGFLYRAANGQAAA